MAKQYLLKDPRSKSKPDQRKIIVTEQVERTFSLQNLTDDISSQNDYLDQLNAQKTGIDKKIADVIKYRDNLKAEVAEIKKQLKLK